MSSRRIPPLVIESCESPGTHTLRHTAVVMAAQAQQGATPAELTVQLEQADARMAMRYQRLARGRGAEIARRLPELSPSTQPGEAE